MVYSNNIVHEDNSLRSKAIQGTNLLEGISIIPIELKGGYILK